MSAEGEDPGQTWLAISRWYAALARHPHLEYLTPMIELAAWVSEQPMAARLYPCTSLVALCVELKRGYSPDRPCFCCGIDPDGSFHIQLWAGVGRSLDEQSFPVGRTREAFAEFVGRLEAIAE